MKQWTVVLLLLFLFVFGSVTSVAAQDGRPTFYPNRAGQEQPGTRPVPEQDVPAGRDILGADPAVPYGYGYPDYRPEYRPGLSPMLMTGDPISLIPHAIDLANKYGTVTASRPGSWRVDYRKRPIRSIYDIVRDIHDLPVTVLRSLFETARESAPEYEEGYRTITDSFSRFCMLLFAQAIANERMQQRWEMGPKRVERESSDLPGDAEGAFYYGSHAGEVLRLVDIKNELRCSNGVRGRQQTVEFPITRMAYLYLVWPVRFGLPARNRIVVDGLLNSAWNISYLTDQEEQYVVFRSEYKIRTDTPVRIEIP